MEGVRCGESGALGRVNVCTILRQAFPESRGFLDQFGTISGLRSKIGGFVKAAIPHPRRIATTLDPTVMDYQYLDDGQIVSHSANFP